MSSELKSLVIVDDSPVMLELLNKLVQGFEANTFVTGDYQAAVDYCTNNRVDILITDLNLDDHSGFSLIEVARQNDRSGNFTSFVMSAESAKSYRETMKALQVKGWIMKPLSPDSFKSFLQNLLKS